MIPNKTKPKEMVLEFLKTKGMIRKRELLNELSPSGVSKRFRYAEITIKRAIEDLAIEEEIVIIKNKGFPKYGIVEKDKRAVYLALKMNANEQKLITRLIKSLGSKDTPEREIALRELKDKSYLQLSPTHLNQLVDLVNNKKLWDTEGFIFTLDVLRNNISMGVLPIQNKLHELTQAMYGRYKFMDLSKLDEDRICFEKIIVILAFLEDHRLIKILEDVSGKGILNQYKSMFLSWELSKIVLRYDLEIYDLQIKFKNNKETVDALYEIRNMANTKYSGYKTHFLNLEQALKLTQK